MGTINYNHGNLDTNLSITFISMLLCPTNYTLVFCIIYGCGTGTLTFHRSVSPKMSLLSPG
jgi:hypothetical protein